MKMEGANEMIVFASKDVDVLMRTIMSNISRHNYSQTYITYLNAFLITKLNELLPRLRKRKADEESAGQQAQLRIKIQTTPLPAVDFAEGISGFPSPSHFHEDEEDSGTVPVDVQRAATEGNFIPPVQVEPSLPTPPPINDLISSRGELFGVSTKASDVKAEPGVEEENLGEEGKRKCQLADRNQLYVDTLLPRDLTSDADRWKTSTVSGPLPTRGGCSHTIKSSSLGEASRESFEKRLDNIAQKLVSGTAAALSSHPSTVIVKPGVGSASICGMKDLFEKGMKLIYGKVSMREGHRDFVGAAALFMQAAEHGYAPAQHELAEMCCRGLGMAKDENKCQQLHMQAAEQGFLPSLGECYFQGLGRSRNNKVAAELFREAAIAGHVGAQFSLGHLYEMGKGVKKSLHLAVEWYLRSAEQDHIYGQIEVGLAYYQGNGVTRNSSLAELWFHRATRDNVFASKELGLRLFQGDGVSKDYHKAVSFLEQTIARSRSIPCCQAELADAYTVLGWCYEDGKGVTKDKARARQHYRQGWALGDVDAKKSLKQMDHY